MMWKWKVLKSFLIILTPLIIIGFLIGCGKEVYVRDIHDKPISGADVTVITLSMGQDMGKTNKHGAVSIGWLMQQPLDISASKDGYITEEVQYPNSFPMKITLQQGKGNHWHGMTEEEMRKQFLFSPTSNFPEVTVPGQVIIPLRP